MSTKATATNTYGITVGDPAVIRREGGTLFLTQVTRVTKTQFTAGLEGHRFRNDGRPVTYTPGGPVGAATEHHTGTFPGQVSWALYKPAQELGLRLVGDSSPHVYQKAGEYLGTVGPVYRGIRARSERVGEAKEWPDYAMALTWLQSTPAPTYKSREYYLQGFRHQAVKEGVDYVDWAAEITGDRTPPEQLDDDTLACLYMASLAVD